MVGRRLHRRAQDQGSSAVLLNRDRAAKGRRSALGAFRLRERAAGVNDLGANDLSIARLPPKTRRHEGVEEVRRSARRRRNSFSPACGEKVGMRGGATGRRRPNPATRSLTPALSPPYGARGIQNGISSSIGPAPAPAAPPLESAGRRSAPEARLKLRAPPSSGKLSRASPPLPRESSSCNSPRNRCSTTSVVYLSAPLWSCHLRVCSWPSM